MIMPIPHRLIDFGGFCYKKEKVKPMKTNENIKQTIVCQN